MSKDEIQRLYNELGIGDETARRRYAELSRMDEEDARESRSARSDPRQWLRWDNTCGPAYDEEC